MNKTIIVTGGTGFLGGQLVKMLKATRPEYIVYGFGSADYDLTDNLEVRKMFAVFQPSIVIHCAAAVGGIQANQQQPGRFFRDNLLMGAHVIHASADHHVEKICLIGTVCSYPKYCTPPFHIKDLWTGRPEDTNASYGIAKLALMEMLSGYQKQYGLQYVCPVLSNLYGPGDDFSDERSHVIPALIKRFVDAKENDLHQVEVWGSGTATRNFLYIDDAVRIIMNMVSANFSGCINVGSEMEYPIDFIASIIRKLVGFSGGISWNTTKPDGQPRRAVNSPFGHGLISISVGLSRTIDWYMNNRSSALSD